MKTDLENGINHRFASNSMVYVALFLLISSLQVFATVAHAQDEGSESRPVFDDQELSDFMRLSPAARGSIMQRLSPLQQRVLDTQLDSEGAPGASTPAGRPLIPEETEEELKRREKKERETMEEQLPSEAAPKSLFERYRPTERYQEISTDLKPFGHAFFKELSVDVQMTAAKKTGPVSSEYIVGPNDEVIITLWGRINSQYYRRVKRNGTIAIPNVGPIKVAGMSFDEMSGHVTEEIQKIFGAKAEVSMGGLKTIQVFVLGEIKKPGMYPLDSLSTITNALLAAGGPSDIGSLRRVKLNRGDKTVAVMDFYDLLTKGDKSQDKVLMSGDVVFVPTVGSLIGVAGNVKRPAIYELKEETNLSSVFELAGGIIPSAYTQQIQVERIKKNEKEIAIDINDKDLKRSREFLIQDGDLVKVFSIVEKIENVVTLSGNVKRPGKYEYTEGMRLTDIIKDKQELKEETQFDYAIIKRRLPPEYQTKLVSFNLEKAILEDGIELKPRDEIHIFSKWSFRSRPYVTVEGEVRELEAYNELRKLLIPYRELREKAAGEASKGKEVSLEIKSKMEDLEKKIEIQFPYSTVVNQFKLEDLEAKTKTAKAKGEETSLKMEVEIEKLKQAIENKKIYSSLISAKSKLESLVLDQGKTQPVDPKTRKEIIEEIEKLRGAMETRSPESAALLVMRIEEIKSRIAQMESKRAKPPLETQLELDPEKTKQATAMLDQVKVSIFENSRVKDAILAAGGLTENAYPNRSEIVRTDPKGEVTRILFDAGKALDDVPEENVLLKDKDKIIIHSKWEIQYKQTVSVKGEVNNPGSYPHTTGMRVSDLVFAAGNLLESAYLDEAELTSFLVVGQEKIEITRLNVNLKKAMSYDSEHNLSVGPNSELLIKKVPDWGVRSYANITGEVKFPGRYNLRKGERLSSLIERAGGFTSDAYLRGAEFSRERVRMLQQENLDQMASRVERQLLERSVVAESSLFSRGTPQVPVSDMSMKKEFIEGLKALKAKGRLTTVILPLEVMKNSPYDMELEDGDRLHIPTNPQTVQVVGAVFNQTAFRFHGDRDYQGYIELAGGMTDMADKDKIYILKADGTAIKPHKGILGISWSDKSSRWEWGGDYRKLEPGDTVIVPVLMEKISWLRSLKDISGFLYETAVTVGVINNLFNLTGN